jgi:dTDP-4-dehydrorhamnose 3,5-epimerase
MKPSILETTLAAAKKDRQTVTPDGKPMRALTDGVVLRDLTVHVDDRGSVCELFDPRWQWHPEPLLFSYCFTIRPGYVKGWNLHERHEDRYALLQGQLELVLYDPRPESKTYGEVCKIVLSEHDRKLVNIPRNVWHADHNIGSKDVLVVNFPTLPYDHAKPDKLRLPIDSDLIPYKFDDAKGY